MEQKTKTVTKNIGNEEQFKQRVTEELAKVSIVRYKEGVSAEITGKGRDILLSIAHAVVAFADSSNASTQTIMRDLHGAVKLAKMEKGTIDSDDIMDFFNDLLSEVLDEDR